MEILGIVFLANSFDRQISATKQLKNTEASFIVGLSFAYLCFDSSV